jgi:hypothetical protein
MLEIFGQNVPLQLVSLCQSPVPSALQKYPEPHRSRIGQASFAEWIHVPSGNDAVDDVRWQSKTRLVPRSALQLSTAQTTNRYPVANSAISGAQTSLLQSLYLFMLF